MALSLRAGIYHRFPHTKIDRRLTQYDLHNEVFRFCTRYNIAPVAIDLDLVKKEIYLMDAFDELHILTPQDRVRIQHRRHDPVSRIYYNMVAGAKCKRNVDQILSANGLSTHDYKTARLMSDGLLIVDYEYPDYMPVEADRDLLQVCAGPMGMIMRYAAHDAHTAMMHLKMKGI